MLERWLLIQMMWLPYVLGKYIVITQGGGGNETKKDCEEGWEPIVLGGGHHGY